MTITRLIPSLRLMLPDPLDIDLWPEATAATVRDVIVAGISLTRVAEVCGTPCVHSGAAVIPGSGGRAAPSHTTAVVVCSIASSTALTSGLKVVSTDIDFDDHRVIWSELRLVGRASAARASIVLVARNPEVQLGDAEAALAAVELPADLVVGDLLALPSRPRVATPNHSEPVWLSHLD